MKLANTFQKDFDQRVVLTLLTDSAHGHEVPHIIGKWYWRHTTHYQNFILWLRHLNFKGENASISSLRNNLWIRILVKIAVVCLSDLQVTPFTNGRHRSPEQLCLSISILMMLNKRETILFIFITLLRSFHSCSNHNQNLRVLIYLQIPVNPSIRTKKMANPLFLLFRHS